MAKNKTPPSITWKQFRIEYEKAISKLAASTQSDWYRAADELEKVCKPKYLADVDRACLIKFVEAMKGKRADSTQKLYFVKIKAGLLWAYHHELLTEKPRLLAKDFIGTSETQSPRAVTDLEFQKILDTVPLVRKQDTALWIRFLRASNWCDLRISELLRLSWDTTQPLCLVRGAEGQMMFHFRTKAAQKAWHPTYHAMAPEFWEIVSKDDKGTRLENPVGFVFPMRGFEYPEIQMSERGVQTIVRKFGELSGVITQDETGKPATCHDFGRRAFIARMQRRHNIWTLQRLVRHASLETTAKHYNSQTAIELGKELGWNA